MMPSHSSIEMMRTIAASPGDLIDQVVFVGGSVCTLLITDPAAPPIRPTKDVDVILDESRRSGYYQFEAALHEKKFQIAAPPSCRWEIGGVLVDVMTTDANAGGFSSRWYSLAFATAKTVDLGDGISIRHITAPLFLATKLDAFHDRGQGDWRGSHDLEDILSIVDGREELPGEIQVADTSVRDYLADQFRSLLANRNFLQVVPEHLGGDAVSAARAKIVIDRLQQIAAMGLAE